MEPHHSRALPATLHQAAKAGDAVEVERLLADGAALDERDGHGVTALGMAVGYNRLPVARILVAVGADVALIDNRGNTALPLCCRFGPVSCVSIGLIVSIFGADAAEIKGSILRDQYADQALHLSNRVREEGGGGAAAGGGRSDRHRE